MAIDFPNSPTVGQIYTSGDKSWIWDGTVWKAYGASLSPTVLKVDSTNSRVGINNQSPATALDITGALTVSGDVTVDTSTLKVDSTNNRVGVVNASPAYALDVTGDINASSALRIGGTAVGATFSTWTPALTASVTNPTLGTASNVSGRYGRTNKIIYGDAWIVFGTSGTNAGDGFYFLSLPVTATNVGSVIGHGFAYDSSTAVLRFLTATLDTSTRVGLQIDNTSIYGVSHFTPWAWAASDQIRVRFVYEAA